MTIATIFIIDDEPAVRDALSMMVEQEGYHVKAFESAETFLSAYQQEVLGCAVVDVRMLEMSGLALQKLMIERDIYLPIIFLTGHGDIPMSVDAIKSGAFDFLTKPVTRETLLASIRAAIVESDKKLSQHTCVQEARRLLADLTMREKDVLLLAINGFPNKEIARKLNISHRTVEVHKSKIMHKTGAINLLDLASIARDGGIFD
ncbi:MAG: response regulator transcription factor [Methylophilaceae bacterium]